MSQKVTISWLAENGDIISKELAKEEVIVAGIPNIGLTIAGNTIHDLFSKGWTGLMLAVLTACESKNAALNACRSEQAGWLDDESRSIKAIRSILAKPSSEINKVMPGGCSALTLAIQYGHHDIVQMLLNDPGLNNEQQTLAFVYFSKPNDQHTIQMFLNKLTHEQRVLAFGHAVKAGYIEAIKMLLMYIPAAHLQKYNEGKTGLMLAFEGGHTEVVKLLFKHEKEIDSAQAIVKIMALIMKENNQMKTISALLEDRDILISCMMHISTLTTPNYQRNIALLIALINHRNSIWQQLTCESVRANPFDGYKELLINICQSENEEEKNRHILYSALFKQQRSTPAINIFSCIPQPKIEVLHRIINELSLEHSYGK